MEDLKINYGNGMIEPGWKQDQREKLRGIEDLYNDEPSYEPSFEGNELACRIIEKLKAYDWFPYMEIEPDEMEVFKLELAEVIDNFLEE